MLSYTIQYRTDTCYYKTINVSFITVTICGKGVFPSHHQAMLWHPLGVSEFNSVLTVPTQRQHQIPQAKRVQSYKTTPGPALLSCDKPRLFTCVADPPDTVDCRLQKPLSWISEANQKSRLSPDFWQTSYKSVFHNPLLRFY